MFTRQRDPAARPPTDTAVCRMRRAMKLSKAMGKPRTLGQTGSSQRDSRAPCIGLLNFSIRADTLAVGGAVTVTLGTVTPDGLITGGLWAWATADPSATKPRSPATVTRNIRRLPSRPCRNVARLPRL